MIHGDRQALSDVDGQQCLCPATWTEYTRWMSGSLKRIRKERLQQKKMEQGKGKDSLPALFILIFIGLLIS